jgi:protein-disulfide isomerase-like protein with CxxC motif
LPQVPYNIERMLYLAAGGDATVVGATMRAFYAAGRADVPPAALEALRGKYGMAHAEVVQMFRQAVSMNARPCVLFFDSGVGVTANPSTENFSYAAFS